MSSIASTVSPPAAEALPAWLGALLGCPGLQEGETRVVVSRTSPRPEVAGGAGITVVAGKAAR